MEMESTKCRLSGEADGPPFLHCSRWRRISGRLTTNLVALLNLVAVEIWRWVPMHITCLLSLPLGLGGIPSQLKPVLVGQPTISGRPTERLLLPTLDFGAFRPRA